MAHPLPSQLQLADHVRACRVGNQVILLDLQRSRYIGVGGTQAHAVGNRIAGWPLPELQSPTDPEDGVIAPILHRLINDSMLVERTTSPRHQTAVPLAAASLNAEESNRSPFRFRHLVRLCRVTLIASHWVRKLSLEEIVQRVQALRARRTRNELAEEPALRQTVAVYLWLRPFVLTSFDQCLIDSLALLLYLASDGLFPTWVVGVRTQPFGAHSWLQQGATVVNDHHERVRRFEPILNV